MTATPADAATELVADLESAGFVRVISRADGDALAASGVVARALADRGTPFHVSVAATIGERTERARAGGGNGDEVTLVVGTSDVQAVDDTDGNDPSNSSSIHHLEPDDRPASLLACELVAAFEGASPDPVLALAGAFAAGVEPGAGETEWLLESATERGLVERRPGVSVPTADLADGLAHTTLCRGPWSGDLEAARALVAEFASGGEGDGESENEDEDEDEQAGGDDVDRKRLASCVALDVVGTDEASTRAAHAVARVLRPHAIQSGDSGEAESADTSATATSRPFATIGGYANVLEGLARSAPGLGVALAMGAETTADVRDRALEAWRDHGRRTHEALDGASTGRYDGLFVVRVGIDDGPVETVARLAAEYRSPEPLVLAISDGEAAVSALDARPLEGALEAIARDLGVGAAYDVGRRRGYVRFDGETADAAIVEAVRETL